MLELESTYLLLEDITPKLILLVIQTLLLSIQSAQDEIETNIDLLNAYITQDVAAIDVELTAGRFVTSWGESTFIPIGMNGLTTNALDLTALRVPGSSIKEALIPTEQITLSGYMDNGWSYEAYYQFGESHVELEEDGQFFGNDAVNGTHVILAVVSFC